MPDMGIDRSYLSPAEPWRDESRDEMLCMTLRVNGKPDCTLVLPADEEYLDAVKAYLDIDVFTDAMLCDIRFKVPYIGEPIRDTDCPAVEDYNDFAEALENIWQQDGMLLTYAAVLEAERPDTLRGACELLRNLDNYQRITEDAYGYGQTNLKSFYLRSINPMIEKINPTIPIPITSSPIPDEQREIIMAKSSTAIPNPIFFIVNPPLQTPIYLPYHSTLPKMCKAKYHTGRRPKS